MYKINEVSTKLGISAHTLRYYEREGLIEPLRDANERRVYSEANIQLLIFITKMREAHMPIAEIRSYIELYWRGDETIKERRDVLVEHLKGIRAEIKNLKSIERYLTDKLDSYDKKHST